MHNGPEGRTVDIVDASGTEHPDVQVRLMKIREGGLGHARNVGLSVARGEYVTFVDDDDRVTPTYLAAMLDEVERNDVVVAMVGNVASPSPGRHLSSTPTSRGRGRPSRAGRSDPGSDRPFSYNAGKLVLTSAARAARYNTALRQRGGPCLLAAGLRGAALPGSGWSGGADALYLRSPARRGRGDRPRAMTSRSPSDSGCCRALESVDRCDPAVDG